MLYRWMVEFADGRIVRQGDDKDFVPHRPPAEYGVPVAARLVPIQDGIPTVEVDVPAGAMPVCKMLRTFRGLDMTPDKMTWRVGWVRDGVRVMIEVDADGKTVRQVCDTV